jgi:transcription antitermination factor NusG
VSTLDLGSWCILRMGSASTLSVFESLKRAGFNVWTPIERKVGRMPRTRAAFDKQFALMPSYVFAHVQHIEDLMRIAMAPHKDHPRFTMFKHQNGFPLIADEELEALRTIEGKKQSIFEKLKRQGVKGPVFGIGAAVRVPEGPFAGLTGEVSDQSGQFTLVNIAGFHRPVKISSILLLPDVAINESSSDIAAQEAA